MLLAGLLESWQTLELRAAKGSGAPGLERASEKELGWEKRSELHVKSGAWTGQVAGIGGRTRLVLVAHGLRVQRRDVASARMAVGKARDVRGEGAMGETSVAIGGLGSMALETAGAIRIGATLADGCVEVLHP